MPPGHKPDTKHQICVFMKESIDQSVASELQELEHNSVKAEPVTDNCCFNVVIHSQAGPGTPVTIAPAPAGPFLVVTLQILVKCLFSESDLGDHSCQ